MKVICSCFNICKNEPCYHKKEHEEYLCSSEYCYFLNKYVKCVPAIPELRKLKIKKLNKC